jgi:hypothetical protein
LPTVADLVDELTINQIKQVLGGDADRHRARQGMLEHDLALLFGERPMALTPRLLRILIVLAQTNLHIWTLKDRAQREPERYMEHLKLAHQLNGIRNRMKNALLDAGGEGDPAVRKSNCDLDGLEGWSVGIE